MLEHLRQSSGINSAKSRIWNRLERDLASWVARRWAISCWKRGSHWLCNRVLNGTLFLWLLSEWLTTTLDWCRELARAGSAFANFQYAVFFTQKIWPHTINKSLLGVGAYLLGVIRSHRVHRALSCKNLGLRCLWEHGGVGWTLRA